MVQKAAKSRLYVKQHLAAAQTVVPASEQLHFLKRVMRLRIGGSVALFNGVDGEWRAELRASGKKHILFCQEQMRTQLKPMDRWLLFAPVRRSRSEFAVEKAAELGVAKVCPVLTEFANDRGVRTDRWLAVAIEAAEQCGAMHVPEICKPTPLLQLLGSWPKDRMLIYCDETLPGNYGFPIIDRDVQRTAILIGPEGGFSPKERALLKDHECTAAAGLGSRILRTETAAVAALSLLSIPRRSL